MHNKYNSTPTPVCFIAESRVLGEPVPYSKRRRDERDNFANKMLIYKECAAFYII